LSMPVIRRRSGACFGLMGLLWGLLFGCSGSSRVYDTTDVSAGAGGAAGSLGAGVGGAEEHHTGGAAAETGGTRDAADGGDDADGTGGTSGAPETGVSGASGQSVASSGGHTEQAGGPGTGGTEPAEGGGPGDGCVEDLPCTPDNPCHLGATACTGGVVTCIDLGTNQANGTVCGSDAVCKDGECQDCEAEASCEIEDNPCRVGTITCGTGSPVCTESGNVPNGEVCGDAMVCDEGVCGECVDGASCTPDDPCHEGALDCSGGTPECQDTGDPLAVGSACGTDQVCSASGECVDCADGETCTPDLPCKAGSITCNTGAPVCAETGNLPNGTSCGEDNVCSDGACVPCEAGLACVPDSEPCHSGEWVCSPSPECGDTGDSVSNGTACGTDHVCNHGECTACTADAPCTPSTPCKTGVVSCDTGASVCVESGNAPNGSSCGSNLVCSDGECEACSAGSACVPANPCHDGELSCNTGTPSCVDAGTNLSNGTSCGTNLVCKNGSCVSCTEGNACTPSNPCHSGQTSCETGSSTCSDTGAALTDGTGCGLNKVCNGGDCVSCTAGASCSPSSCRTGTTSCESGSQTCVASGNVANGTSCGSNKVCNAGSCVSCTAGVSCSYATCQNGTTSCSTGSSVCTFSSNAANGTSCGTNKVCSGGSCVSCTAGLSCSTGKACEIGQTSCATGSSTCVKTGNQPPGTACGTGQTCTGTTKKLADACNSSGSCITGATSTCLLGCIGNDCAPLLPIGYTCSASNLCESGYCIGTYPSGVCATSCGDKAGAGCCVEGCNGSGLVCGGTNMCLRCGTIGYSCCTGNVCNTGTCVDGTCS
jgi:hypothetical protein